MGGLPWGLIRHATHKLSLMQKFYKHSVRDLDFLLGNLRKYNFIIEIEYKILVSDI